MGWSFEIIDDHGYEDNMRVIGTLRPSGIRCMGVIHSADLFQSHMPKLGLSPPLILNMDIVGEIRVQVSSMDIRDMYIGYPTNPSLDEWHIIGGERESNIYVEKESVSDLLLKIKELQTPKAKAILKKQGDKLIIPDAKMTAKILSF